MTTALRVALRGVVVLALCLMGSAFAQDAFPQAGDRPETSLAERIDRLVARLDATRERIAPLIDAVDVTDAEAWLEASPLAHRARGRANGDRGGASPVESGRPSSARARPPRSASSAPSS